MLATRWEPWTEMNRLTREMDRLFGSKGTGVGRAMNIPVKERRAPRNRNQPNHHDFGAQPWLDRSGSRKDLEPRQRTSRQITVGTSHYQNRRSAIEQFFTEPFSLEKVFTMFSFLVACGLFVLCSLDLAIAWPFMDASRLFDWTYLVCALVLLFLTYDVFKDQTKMYR